MKKSKFISEYSFKRIVEAVNDDRIVEDLIDRKVVSIASLSWYLAKLKGSPRLLAKVAAMPLLPEALDHAIFKMFSLETEDEVSVYAILLEPIARNPFVPSYVRSNLWQRKVWTVLLNPAITETEALSLIEDGLGRGGDVDFVYVLLKCKFAKSEHFEKVVAKILREPIGNLYPKLLQDVLARIDNQKNIEL